jgi:uncharacterized lipoprotein YddW (UPF0748 family)
MRWLFLLWRLPRLWTLGSFSQKEGSLVRQQNLWLAVFCLLTVPGQQAGAEFSDFRGLFVNRFEYGYNTNSIDAIMQNASDLGITDVMFQVRGRGDAFYDSNFEPRANGLPGSFDPLQTAIDAAHTRGLKLHAWLNTTTLWNINTPPPAGHMLYNTNPSFRITGTGNDLEPQDGWSGTSYSSVNPVLPEVHTHINNVVDDIATNYSVDGVHLDYIRYIPGNSFDRLPHDQLSHDLFFNATGLNGASPSNATAYRNYMKQRITDLVSSVKTTVDTAEVSSGRTMELTASVWRDPDIGENDYYQDYRSWLEQDLLDIAMPMIYLNSSNDYLFEPNLLNSLNITSNSRVAPTLGVYLHTAGGGGVELTTSQLQRAYNLGSDGASLYGYGAMFTDPLASERQAAVAAFYDSLVGAPGNVIDDFELDEGHFGWSYNQSPASQTNGLSAATTIERVTSEAQAGIASQQLSFVDGDPNAGWQIRHNSGIGAGLNTNPAGNVELVATGYIGFWLKTSDPGASVQIAIDDPGTAERGIVQDIIADDQWRLYQWNLENPDDWEGWVNGDGEITEPTITIDSIFFYGNGDTTIYLDTVSHNPQGLLAPPLAPADFDQDGDVDGADLSLWQTEYAAGDGADADGDGDTDGSDFLMWQRGYTGAGALAAALAVPEPTSLLLLFTGLLSLGRRPVAGLR